MKQKYIDRSGKKFGLWKVLSVKDDSGKIVIWNCQCVKCGKIEEFPFEKIWKQRFGNRTTCNCQKKGKITTAIATSELREQNKIKNQERIEQDVKITVIVEQTKDPDQKVNSASQYLTRPKLPENEKGKREAYAYAKMMLAKGCSL